MKSPDLTTSRYVKKTGSARRTLAIPVSKGRKKDLPFPSSSRVTDVGHLKSRLFYKMNKRCVQEKKCVKFQPAAFSLHIEQVPEFVALGLQILLIILVRWNLDRDALLDAKAVTVEAHDLARVVGEETDFADSEVIQDLGADAVVAEVSGVTEPAIGFDGV